MEDSLSENPQHRRKNWLVVMLVLQAAVIVAGASTWFFVASGRSETQTAISAEIRKQVPFPIYYPDKLPRGYTIGSSDIKWERDVLFMTFRSENGDITVSEVAMPEDDPGLTWSGFAEISIQAGKAYVGSNGGRPVALIDAGKTLLNVTGAPTVANNTVNALISALRTLPD